MARSAPSSISQIEPNLLHDLQPKPEDASPTCTPDQLLDSSPIAIPTPPVTRVNRAFSWGSPWGVVTVGRGLDWKSNSNTGLPSPDINDEDPDWGLPLHVRRKLALNTASLSDATPSSRATPTTAVSNTSLIASPSNEILSTSAPPSTSPLESRTPTRPSVSRSATAYSSRRRYSAKRVSLVAGRVSVIPNDPVATPPTEPARPSSSPRLSRFGSASSFLSVQSAAAPSEKPSDSFLGGRSIDEFVIEEEIGRGAYGLVKKAREIQSDGTLGVRFALVLSVKAIDLVTLASDYHKTNHQVSYSGRLLEETPQVRHNPHRNLRYVCNIVGYLHSPQNSTLGCRPAWRSLHLDRRQQRTRAPKHLPAIRLF